MMKIRDRIPEPAKRFWREKIAPRPIASGSVASVVLGMAVGGVLAAGSNFEPPPPMEPVPRALRATPPAPQPITYMKGADGKIPDWVIGTDNIPGRETWRDRLPVRTTPDEEDFAEAPRRGLGWLLQPWRWGRSEERAPPRPSRSLDSERRMDRQAVMEQYERDRARYERERERWERQYAEAEEQRAMERERRYSQDMRPRYDTRAPPGYDPRDDDSEEAPYPFEQAPPPPERWRY